MSELHPTVARLTERIIERSKDSRRRYLDLMAREGDLHADRNTALPCSNLAHAFAAMEQDKESIATRRGPNIGIVSAYNDTISSHQPFGAYPPLMKVWAREAGATAQVAGCTPAMCDGVTQGLDGMELSLFSRDVIALSTAVSLSHAMYDAVAMLGMCDRDQCAGRSQGRVVEVVFYAKVNVEFDQHLVEERVTLLAVHRCLADLAAEALDHHMVVFQHVVRVHLAPPFPTFPIAVPRPGVGCSSPRTSTTPSTTRAS